MHIIFIISPLVILAALGYFCAKTQWLNQEQFSGLSKFTFNLAFPAFLFYQMANADLSSQLQPSLFLSFYLPVLICYSIAAALNYYFHKEHHHNIGASAVFGLGASYSNNVIVGLPLLLLLVGEQALPILFLIVTFHSALLFSLTSGIATKNNSMNWFSFIKQTLSNPLIMAILSGLALNILSIKIPEIIGTPIQMLGKSAIAIALFVLGASIATYQVRSEAKYIAMATTIKLVLLPCLVFVMGKYIFALDPFVIKVLVIMAACPTGVNAYLIAATHQVHRKAVASTVVVSTVASVITLPLWIWWLG